MFQDIIDADSSSDEAKEMGRRTPPSPAESESPKKRPGPFQVCNVHSLFYSPVAKQGLGSRLMDTCCNFMIYAADFVKQKVFLNVCFKKMEELKIKVLRDVVQSEVEATKTTH